MDLQEFPTTKDCYQLELQIAALKIRIDKYYQLLNPSEAKKYESVLYLKEGIFKGLGCPAIIEKKNQLATTNVLNKYSDSAETEITTYTTKMRNVYVLIGSVTLVLAALIIISKKR